MRPPGQDRWKHENNGWHGLTQNRAIQNGFLHAGQRRPRIAAATEKPPPILNRGLMALTLVLCLAFAPTSAFTLLRSRLCRLSLPSLWEIARQ